MDSVTVDLMSKWFKRYNEDYQDQLLINEITNWDADLFVKPECGKKIYYYLSEPGFYRDLQPLPHAIEVLKRLALEYTIFIVTTSPKNALIDKVEWVEEHLPFIGSSQIIFTHHKAQVKGDLLFDDAPHNLISFQKSGGIAVAMDYPYNQKVNCNRVSDWLEFESSLKKWLPHEKG